MDNNTSNNTESGAVQPVVVQHASPVFYQSVIVFLMIATIWNWDGFWHIDGFLAEQQEQWFPRQYEQEQHKKKTLDDNNIKISILIKKVRSAEAAKYQAEENLKGKCDLVRTAASMFWEETEKVGQAEAVKTITVKKLRCDSRSDRQKCEIILREAKVNEICPEYPGASSKN